MGMKKGPSINPKGADVHDNCYNNSPIGVSVGPSTQWVGKGQQFPAAPQRIKLLALQPDAGLTVGGRDVQLTSIPKRGGQHWKDYPDAGKGQVANQEDPKQIGPLHL